jgi:cytochrome P450
VGEASLDFFDRAVQESPYESYRRLRDEHPVWLDPRTRMMHVSRYADVRRVLTDGECFGAYAPLQSESRSRRQQRVYELFRANGWVPAPTLFARDEPEHRQMRALFAEAFRPARIRQLDGFVRDTAYRLLDVLLPAGRCEWVRQFAVPLPLTIIVQQMGADPADMWKIKGWTDAFFRRIGMMLSEEQELATVEREIEAQHYFQPIFERLRECPDDTLLSDLVNTPIPEWGRPLSDEELHAEMMADTFVGGSETTTNALSAGMKLLVENPEVWARLKRGSEADLRAFVEEVLRLESPGQVLLKRALVEVELAGVTIPKDSVIAVRYAAANRDEREFPDPDRIDLDRQRPGAHLAFGSGPHHCIGAPLARRELWWGFRALLDRVDAVAFTPGANDFAHHPHYMLRSLVALHVELVPAKREDAP